MQLNVYIAVKDNKTQLKTIQNITEHHLHHNTTQHDT